MAAGIWGLCAMCWYLWVLVPSLSHSLDLSLCPFLSPPLLGPLPTNPLVSDPPSGCLPFFLLLFCLVSPCPPSSFFCRGCLSLCPYSMFFPLALLPNPSARWA